MEQTYVQRMTTEEYTEMKKQEREEAFALVDATAQEVVQDDLALKTFFAHIAECRPTNTPNQLFLYAQDPTYTEVRTFEQWQERGRSPQKGTTAIPFLKGHEYEKDGELRIGYNVLKGFDVSQTRGQRRKYSQAELPQAELTSTDAIAIVQGVSTVNIQTVELPEDMDAVYLPEDKTVFLRDGQEPDTAFIALSRELAHAHFDWWDQQYDRESYENVANCASYIAACRVGADTSGFDFSDVCKSLRDKEPGEIREFLSDASHGAQRTTICLDKYRQQQREGAAKNAPAPER